MQHQIKNIAILGSTGSIGTQALEVIDANPSLFKAVVLTAQSNVDLLITQALKFNPDVVVIGDEDKYQILQQALKDTSIIVKAGANALCEVVEISKLDIVLTALVGFAGLKPTIAAINVPVIIIIDLSQIQHHHSLEHEPIQLQQVSHHHLNVHLKN